MVPRRRTASAAGRGGGGGGGGKKRPRPKVDLSGHGGRYEDAYGDDDDDVAPALRDEDVQSDDEDDDRMYTSGDEGAESEENEDEEETADAKRLRLARDYLSKMGEEGSSSSDEDDEDGDDGMDRVGRRIAKERLRKSGLLRSRIADSISEGVRAMSENIASKLDAYASAAAEVRAKAWLDAKHVTFHRGHDLTPTCVALSRDGHHAFSGAKDGSLFSWDVDGGRRASTILPAVGRGEGGWAAGDRNKREILAVAASDDGRYLAVGGRDNCVRVFDVRTSGKVAASSSAAVAKFEGHKGAVTSLAFRTGTLDLYSGSEDRCIRRYDLDSLTYVETLYGHQSPVLGMDCASRNRPVSVSRDRTVRVWKVEEDSHLVFRPGGDAGGAECISALLDGWFATGHEDGRLALWREEKKKPVGEVVLAAHGQRSGSVAWGVACCDAPGWGDAMVTGSGDGFLRFWKVGTDDSNAGIESLDAAVPIHGYVNDVALGPGGKFCVAAVGQEPRLGRWDRVPRAKNRFAVIRLDNGTKG